MEQSNMTIDENGLPVDTSNIIRVNFEKYMKQELESKYYQKHLAKINKLNMEKKRAAALPEAEREAKYNEIDDAISAETERYEADKNTRWAEGGKNAQAFAKAQKSAQSKSDDDLLNQLQTYYKGNAKFQKKEKELEAGPKEETQNENGQQNYSSDDRIGGGDYIASVFASKFLGNNAKDPMGRDTGTLNQAIEHEKQSAKEDSVASEFKGMFHRNHKVEADKEAAAGAASVNKQTMNNYGNDSEKGTSANNAAALLRTTKDSNYDAAYQRKMDAEQRATEHDRAAENAKQVAIQERTASEGYGALERDRLAYNNEATNLAMGKPSADSFKTGDTQPPKPVEKKPEAVVKDKDETAQYGTNWHNVLNYITFGNDKTSGWSNDTKDGGKARKFAEAHGWKPVTMTQAEYDATGAAADGHRQQIVAKNAPEFYTAWQQGSKRFDAQGNQTNAGDNGVTTQDFQNQSGIEVKQGATNGQSR